MRQKSQAVLPSTNFFEGYTRIIFATFSLVTVVSSSLFYLQFRSRYQNELEQLQARFLQEASSLNYLVKGASDHVHSLKTEAEFYLATHSSEETPSLLLSQLQNLPEEDYYVLDQIQPPFTKDMVGNVTGIGSVEQISPDVKREIEMALSLNPLFQASRENIPNLAWVYYISESRFVNIYPWVSSSEYLIKESDYDQDFYQLGLPENNPQRQIFWTHAYTDTAGKGLMVTISAPIYDKDNFLGTIALDFTLDVLNETIKNSAIERDRQINTFIINQYDQLLAHPDLVNSTDAKVKSIQAALPEDLQNQFKQLLQTPADQINSVNSYILLHHQLDNAPWKLVLWVPKTAITLKALSGTNWLFLALLPGLGLILIVANHLTRKRFILPARKLVEHIETESQGIISDELEVPKIWQPWFERISYIFGENRTLLQRLEAYTQQLEAKNADLQRTENLLAEHNRNLEIQVEERTNQLKQVILQLRQQTQDLENTLEELRQTQTQLIQSEKMSSMGQLVAGVAHEINNPVNFIYGNIEPASNYVEDLFNLIDLYQEYYPNSSPIIQAKLEEIELEFLKEDLPKLLSSMQMGAERIRQIVLSLRNFSRLDEAEFKAVDIHEGIENTLIILEHRLKAKPDCPAIKVIKEYGELPLVECYAGQLNQVFMNVLTNAIDALEEQNQQCASRESKSSQGYIHIRTKLTDNNQVTIKIADNGSGMSEKVKHHIFDPFFTTKSADKGTGMGMSISYQIVTKNHDGSLGFISSPGQGTEFVIEIPLQQRVKFSR
ncbi:GHKL domain-containing protein [Oculatella sp. FACHB-28]|uniref:sensor histidine kinase n=1 Tax=Oculatella sp. FACHB-28 TaxID=2692845 RepID=UPI001681DDDB|nr:ATP-binding protein [Oculatella sp. FACHB-28]MBD2056173.1 GHKL domain-containing protein [Oculatella sp. FACHB-28]